MNQKEQQTFDDAKSNVKPDLVKSIQNLLHDQPFSVLCTQGDCQPYGSLVAFAYSNDMKHLYFITPTETRKYMLLNQCANVSMVIDSRSLHPDNMKEVEAVTITGKARQIEQGEEYQKGIRMLKDRHPYMKDFLETPSTALFRIDVSRYYYVSRFQKVAQWTPDQEVHFFSLSR
ncbi:MAG: pyridoxamine 5'-phosphate oxidase family protein [Fidelibacterota bacterium]